MPHAVVEEELSLLANVLEKLDGEHDGEERPDYDELLTSLRDAVAAAKPEDQPPLVEQMHRVAALARQHGQGRSIPVDKGSPYFGHLRLNEDGRERDVLIGKVSHVDAKREVRIVDWRNAPVSRLYYCYDEGDEYQETFGTRPVKGTVEIRRSVTVDESQLRRVGSTEGTFVLRPDGGWKQAVSQAARLQGGQGTALRPRAEHKPRGRTKRPGQRRSARRGGGAPRKGAADRAQLGVGPDGLPREDKRLPEITALIDRPQFELITHPDSGLVVIRGGAGSGKTTVGLHRIAYLGYQYPERYRPDRMMVVVYNQALEAYIGQVLPALGFSGVRTATFSHWASSIRRRLVRGLPSHYAPLTPPVVSRAKKHPRILGALEEAASRVDGRSPTSIVEAWTEALTDRGLLRRHLVETERRPITDHNVEEIVEWSVRQHRELDERSERDSSRKASSAEGWLDVEDDALLLRLYQFLRGPLRSSSNRPFAYEHLMIDEAQDLSPVELAVLLQTTTRQSSITLAGDSAQRLDLDSGFESWEELFDDLGLDPLTVSPLEISYRSTAEIMEFAQVVLGDLADPQVTYRSTHSGAPVELLHLAHDGEAVAILGEALRELSTREPLASVAVVARYPERADMYYEGLLRSEVPRLRRVADQDFSFKPGVEVTDVRQVKGLEFDYVVLLDVDRSSYPATDTSRHLLHIGSTRAAHQLWLVCTRKPSPLLPSWLV